MSMRHFDVVIVGGGLSGTILAIQLMRAAPLCSIAIVDRSSQPHRGVAYATRCDRHVLNVPAHKMSLFPDDPDHFLRWLHDRFGPMVRRDDFLPRSVYGDYIEQTFATEIVCNCAVQLTWIKEEIVSANSTHHGIYMRQANGFLLQTKYAVLATGNAPPSDLSELAGLKSAAYQRYAWASTDLPELPANGTVLILGTGLTAVDKAIELCDQGFQGQIFMLSRRGMLPLAHLKKAGSPWRQPIDVAGEPRISRVVAQVRALIRLATAQGCEWRSVVDALRPSVAAIWRGLDAEERSRFLRHVRPFWDAARHRLPSDVALSLRSMVASGRLHVMAGRMTKAEEHEGVLIVTCKLRASGKFVRLGVDRIVNCTGPRASEGNLDALYRNLLRSGLACLDPNYLGVRTAVTGELLAADSKPSQNLFTIGPVQKADLWESTAVAEIRHQGVSLASLLAARLAIITPPA